MTDARRSFEEVRGDILANASALVEIVQRWPPEEAWTQKPSLVAANGTVIELTRLMNELRKVRSNGQ